MSNIRSRIARLEKTTIDGNVHVQGAEIVRKAGELYQRFRIGLNVRSGMDAAELRRRLEDDSLPANERRVYMRALQYKTDDDVERQTIQAKLTQMGWEEIKALRRQAGDKGLSKRRREALFKVAAGHERVLRMRHGEAIH